MYETFEDLPSEVQEQVINELTEICYICRSNYF